MGSAKVGSLCGGPVEGAPRRGFHARADDDFDDNPDDSYHSNHTHYSPILAVSCLFRGCACSWQCGGQGFESP